MALEAILAIPPAYGQVMIITSGICFLLLAISWFYPYRTRTNLFNKNFMEFNFQDMHEEAIGEEINPHGYPDMGEGRYSEMLGYYDWLIFNNSQRSHYNFIEEIGATVFLLLIGGVIFPVPAMSIGFIYFIGRAFYSLYYNTVQGANHYYRVIGSVVCRLSVLAAFILDIVVAVMVLINKYQ